MPAWARPSTTAPAATPSTARYRCRLRRGRDSTREAPEGGDRLTRSRASGLADALLLRCQDRTRKQRPGVNTIRPFAPGTTHCAGEPRAATVGVKLTERQGPADS